MMLMNIMQVKCIMNPYDVFCLHLLHRFIISFICFRLYSAIIMTTNGRVCSTTVLQYPIPVSISADVQEKTAGQR